MTSKAALRAKMKEGLKQLLLSSTLTSTSTSTSAVENKTSQLFLNQLAALPEYRSALCVSIFLSMPTEVQTLFIIEHALSTGKRVVVPKITGNLPPDMIMVELSSLSAIESFPKSKWGIPEPPSEYISKYPDLTHTGLIDLVLVPGVAFDRTCARLGHGKGYYDSFLSRIAPATKDKDLSVRTSSSSSIGSSSSGTPESLSKSRPVTSVGIGFDEQILEQVPMDANDRYLDFVITPSSTFARNALPSSSQS